MCATKNWVCEFAHFTFNLFCRRFLSSVEISSKLFASYTNVYKCLSSNVYPLFSEWGCLMIDSLKNILVLLLSSNKYHSRIYILNDDNREMKTLCNHERMSWRRRKWDKQMSNDLFCWNDAAKMVANSKIKSKCRTPSIRCTVFSHYNLLRFLLNQTLEQIQTEDFI